MQKKLKKAIKNGDDLHKILSEAWLNIYVHDENQLYNPLENIPEYCSEKPELFITWLMSQPEYFSFICKELCGVNIFPLQSLMLELLWKHKFPMLIGSRGLSKTFTLAMYATLRALLLRKRKILIAGAGFRQSKLVFNYIESFINNSEILRNILYSQGIKNPIQHNNDEWRLIVADSTVSAIPLGDGQKIRGKRANDILADEFASIPIEIFETVVAGFAAVSSSPVDSLKRAAARKCLIDWGLDPVSYEDLIEVTDNIDNQIVISGTAYYDFNHFSAYHKRWKEIIKSRGNKETLAKIIGGPVPESFDHSDYCILRFPYELLPPGFMDDAQVARSRATMSSSNYSMEFSAVFSRDSDGFFKRTLIEACVVSDNKDVVTPNGKVYSADEVFFEPMMFGKQTKQHIIGIDTASKKDNFAIVVLELDGELRKVVHVWTTNEKDHREKLELGFIHEHNFYAYASRKIRELMRRFPTIALAIDSEGGGRAVMEALRDKDKLGTGEMPIYHIIDPQKPNPDDGEVGLHIIHEIHFADATWTSNANHGLKKDMEDRIVLFPYIDPVSLIVAEDEDEEKKRHYDTLQQCIKDCEELKNELSAIIVLETPSGREQWTTPDMKLSAGQRKEKMKKDRYSSLLMANAVARDIYRKVEIDFGVSPGGFAVSTSNKNANNGNMFTGMPWVSEKLTAAYR